MSIEDNMVTVAHGVPLMIWQVSGPLMICWMCGTCSSTIIFLFTLICSPVAFERPGSVSIDAHGWHFVHRVYQQLGGPGSVEEDTWATVTGSWRDTRRRLEHNRAPHNKDIMTRIDGGV